MPCVSNYSFFFFFFLWEQTEKSLQGVVGKRRNEHLSEGKYKVVDLVEKVLNFKSERTVEERD